MSDLNGSQRCHQGRCGLAPPFANGEAFTSGAGAIAMAVKQYHDVEASRPPLQAIEALWSGAPRVSPSVVNHEPDQRHPLTEG